MRILIHAGVHRTGSSYLQNCLQANRELLGQYRVGYPGREVHHQKLAWQLYHGKANVETVEELVAPYAEGGVDTVVLSAEDFAIHRNLKWVRRLRELYRVEVVFYLRRQDHWLMSWYNQHVKWPFHGKKSRMDPDEFLECLDEFYWIDYEFLVGRWVELLGAEAVKLGVIEPEQVTDVVDDFAGRLGVDAGTLERPPAGKANDSLPVHVLEVARNLGLYELDAKARAKLLRALRKGLADKQVKANTVYSPAQRNAILDRFEAGNGAVAKGFFGRDSLFLEPRPGPEAPYFRFPEVGQSELLQQWVQPVVHQLLQD